MAKYSVFWFGSKIRQGEIKTRLSDMTKNTHALHIHLCLPLETLILRQVERIKTIPTERSLNSASNGITFNCIRHSAPLDGVVSIR